LDRLDAEERQVFEQLYRYARRNPDWGRFSSRFWNSVRELYLRRGMKPDEIVDQSLYRIGQDLDGRLALAQGHVRTPDYVDELQALLRDRKISRYKLAKRTGVSQDLLSHVFRRRKNLSLASLTRLVDALGYRISFKRKVGAAPIEEAVVDEPRDSKLSA